MSFPTEAISTENLIDEDKPDAARLARADLVEFWTAINALIASASRPGGAALINAGNSVIGNLAKHLAASGGKINGKLYIRRGRKISVSSPDKRQALNKIDCSNYFSNLNYDAGILEDISGRATGSSLRSSLPVSLTYGKGITFLAQANIVDQPVWTRPFWSDGEPGLEGPRGPVGQDYAAPSGGGGNGP